MADHPFVQVPLALYQDPALTDSDRSVYAVLLSFADFKTFKNCRPPISMLAKRAHKQPTVIKRSLRRLEESGWIVRSPRYDQTGQQKASSYDLPKQIIPKGEAQIVTGGGGTECGHDQEPSYQARRPQRMTKTQASIAVMSLILAKAQASQDIDF